MQHIKQVQKELKQKWFCGFVFGLVVGLIIAIII